MPEIKEAIILAGGVGSRMLPATLFSPKEFLPLYDTPILKHIFQECKDAGLKKIHLVLSPRKKAIFDAIMSQGNEPFDVKNRSDLLPSELMLVPEGIDLKTHIQKKPGGVADAIVVALDDIIGDFMVLLGDNVLLSRDIVSKDYLAANTAASRLVDDFQKHGIPCSGVVSVADELVSQYGIAKVENGHIVEIVEKPDVTEEFGNLALCGRYIFPKNSRQILAKIQKKGFGELESINFMTELSKTCGLRAIDLSDHSWYDSGSPSSWLRGQVHHVENRGMRQQDKWFGS